MQPRDTSGRFDFGRMRDVCVCGHGWDVHLAASPHECCGDCDECPCPRFRASRKKARS